MKRRSALLTGLAGLGAFAFLSGRAEAQVAPPAHPQPGAPQAPTARPPQTRIAVMNMLQVLKSYKKFTNMEGEMRNLQKNLETRLAPYKANFLRLQEEGKKADVTPERTEQIQREIRKIQIDASLIEEDGKKELTKRSGEAFTTVYRDVEDAVKRYAEMNGYELVLFFNDRVEPEKHHPANVQQKLLTPAALMPLYVTPGMDITAAIIDSLNKMYPPTVQAPATNPGAGAPMAPAPQR